MRLCRFFLAPEGFGAGTIRGLPALSQGANTGPRGNPRAGSSSDVPRQPCKRQGCGVRLRPLEFQQTSKRVVPHQADSSLNNLSSLDDVQVLDSVLAFTSALYEAEAASRAVRVDAGTDGTGTEQSVRFASSPPSLPLLKESWRGALESCHMSSAPPDAYAAWSAEELMDSMNSHDSKASEGGVDNADMAVSSNGTLAGAAPPPPGVVPASTSASIACGGAPDALPQSIAATFAAPAVPLHRKLLQFMDLVSADDGGDSPSALRRAAALILPGMDMKALLTHGTLEHRHLRGLSLCRCDFSFVRWNHILLEDCDLSRSLFYSAAWQGVTFLRCNFSGCLLKHVCVDAPGVQFEDCDFRLAAVGVEGGVQRPTSENTAFQKGAGGPATVDEGKTARHQRHRNDLHRNSAGVKFLRCNFDLSDFQSSVGLNNASVFEACSNTHLAYRFPLRARNGS